MSLGSWMGFVAGVSANRPGKSFFYTDPEGRRLASWHVYVLLWLLPVIFALATAALFAEAIWKTTATVPTTGEVVRVYDWDGNYGPVFRYTWTDGSVTEASTGNSSPDFNFPVGSLHDIRYFADRKADVVLVGPHNWFVALVIGAITLGVSLFSLYGHARLRRWLRSGARPPA